MSFAAAVPIAIPDHSSPDPVYLRGPVSVITLRALGHQEAKYCLP